ncbi:5'-methylthioadenosine/adenosylhomocysteine nucleosidase [Niallia sp. XMNu-256]|uniref:5'-methylthioadenosine/adenosylhomocysteine nucleosidase n=1 Tax=Niallia sp. XMNu-256 TaxID=3082444 RepID=UPI0030CBC35A
MNIGIIGAMDAEILHYRNSMKLVSQEEKAGITFYTGTLNGFSVVICKCGVGKVNASVCTQILIDQFSVSHVIFTGVAGALAPDLHIGDIVVSSEAMHHDMDATALGFEVGKIPYSEHHIFQADPHLQNLALTVSGEVISEQKVRSGRILSGDQFIASREKVNELYQNLSGSCAEMEGAAVAQVCDMNKVPFVIIRSMSDEADGSAKVNFLEFTEKAAFHSYKIVDGMLKSWQSFQ